MGRRIAWMVVLLAALTAAADNLVVNGDFEKGMKPWAPYRGNWKEPFAVPKIVPCSEPGHGRSAVAVEAKEGVRAAGVSCEVKLPEKNRHFRISLWLKVADIRDGWVQMVLQRRVDGPDGKRKLIRLWSAGTPPTHRGGGKIPWTEFCGEFTLPDDLPPGRDFLVMRLGGANVSGEAWFDNVVIEPAVSWKEQAAQARQNARPSGVNLLRDRWRFRTTEGFVPIRQEGKTFFADIPAGKKAVWTDTVFSVHDNIQGPMRFSFQSRHRISAVLRCSLFPTEQKNDVVHIAEPVGKLDADGFQTYAVEFTPLPHTGRMVITLTAGRKDQASRLEFRNICLERLVPVAGGVSLYKARHGDMQGLFRKSEEPRTNFEFENAGTREDKVSVKVVLADFYGRKVFETTRDFTLPPQSITPCRVEYPRLKLPGFYSVTAEWRSEGGKGRYRGGFVTVEEPLKEPDRTFSFSPWEGDIAWQNVEAQVLLGCGLKGITFFGRFVQDGDFAPVERSVAACEARGLTVVGALPMPAGRFLPKFKPDPEKLKRGEFPYGEDYFQEAKKRITALAERYRGRIKYWILYDELDCSVLRDPHAVEHYIRLARAVCEAFRAVDPDVVITGITVTGHDNKAVPRYPILHQVWPQLKTHLDGLALDAYSSGNTFGPGWTPKDPVSGEFREIVRAAYDISSADGRNRLCIHERGYAHAADLPVDGDHEIARARAYAADFVLTKTMPEVEFVLFFNWRAGNDGPSRQFGFMVHENATPSAAAFAAAARRLAHVKFLHQVRLPHNALQCFAFRRGDTTVVPLWISAEPTDFKIQAEFRCPAVAGLQAFDLQGNPVPIRSEGGEMVLPLSASPLYLETSAAPETVEAALRRGRCRLPELALDLTLVRCDTVRGYVKNLTGNPLQAKLNLTAGTLRCEQTAHLAPDDITAVDFNTPALRNSGTLACTLTGAVPGGQEAAARRDLDYLPLRRFRSMKELEQSPVLVRMDGRTYINDLDSVANKVWSDDADCSAEVRLGCNDSHLLLAVDVRDERHVTPWRGKQIWKGDSLQFAFEPARTAVVRKMKNQLGFLQTDRLYTAALVGKETVVQRLPEVPEGSAVVSEITRDDAKGVTRYRFSIPWNELGTRPEPGTVVGFALVIADTDWEDRQFQYRLELGRGIDGVHDPSKLLSLIVE